MLKTYFNEISMKFQKGDLVYSAFQEVSGFILDINYISGYYKEYSIYFYFEDMYHTYNYSTLTIDDDLVLLSNIMREE